MRETSPAVGGAMFGAAILLALVYGMGYGHQFSDLVYALAGQCGDWLNTAYEAIRQAIAG